MRRNAPVTSLPDSYHVCSAVDGQRIMMRIVVMTGNKKTDSEECGDVAF